LLDVPEDAKQTALRAMLRDCPDTSRLFYTLLSSFKGIPGSPLAYWVTPTVLHLFRTLQPVEADGREARVGLQTSDDFRFARLWTEIPPPSMLGLETTGAFPISAIQAKCIEATKNGIRWVPFAKGGGFHQYSSNHHLFLDWENDGRALKEYNSALYGPVSRNVRSEGCYFRPGITWSYLPHKRGSFRMMPPGSVFSVGGPGLFADGNLLLPMLGVLNSDVFFALIRLFMPRGSAGGQSLKFEVGYIQKVPFPELTADATVQLGDLASTLYHLSFKEHTTDETSVVFRLPRLLLARDTGTIGEACEKCSEQVMETRATVGALQSQVNDVVLEAYGLVDEDRRWINFELSGNEGTEDVSDEQKDESENGGGEAGGIDAYHLANELVSWAVGAAFGRWDVRFAINGPQQQEFPLPLAPFPVCSPGMLVGDDGLPAGEAFPRYPLRIDNNGIVPDDPENSGDIVRRVRDVLELIWKDRTEAIEKEACEILGVRELRDYFRKPGNCGFWMDHVRRYSRSRRKAPIYWYLRSARGNYGLWLYYHRLDKDILFKALLNYVEPKVRLEEDRLRTLRDRKDVAGSSGREAKQIEKDIDRQEQFVSELHDFKDKLRRAADLHLTPDLNDGVVLNIAPLWELVPWKEAKKYWEELQEGKYDWSHIAYQRWPDRVKELCKRDRSVAIAHGLEHLCAVPPPRSKRATEADVTADEEFEVAEEEEVDVES
ncbi:MAG: hypothetical protein AABZ12_11955, partial [Planctomycetota bacterium]